MRRERSRDRLTFQRRGEVRVYSADARNRVLAGEALMGFGSPNIVEDESALIDDDIHSKVMRMLGDSPDSFLVKIGNPFRRNHFLKSFQNEDYYKIVADWRVGMEEGRITEDFLKEMRREHDFGILYDCFFPDADAIDDKGYMVLLTDSDIQRAQSIEPVFHFGQERIGVDVAGGGRNYSTIVIRSRNIAELVLKNRDPDTMSLVGKVIQIRQELLRGIRQTGSLPQVEIYVDVVGVGKGVYDRLCEQIPNVIGVSGGHEPMNKAEYFNKRAENYWRMRDWLLTGGKLKKNDEWGQITDVKYKIASDRKIRIMPKEEMLKEGIDSPDIADALALTFGSPEVSPAYYDQSGAIPNITTKNYDPY